MYQKLFITVVWISQYCNEEKNRDWLHNHNELTRVSGATTYTLFHVGILVVKCVKNDAPSRWRNFYCQRSKRMSKSSDIVYYWLTGCWRSRRDVGSGSSWTAYRIPGVLHCQLSLYYGSVIFDSVDVSIRSTYPMIQIQKNTHFIDTPPQSLWRSMLTQACCAHGSGNSSRASLVLGPWMGFRNGDTVPLMVGIQVIVRTCE